MTSTLTASRDGRNFSMKKPTAKNQPRKNHPFRTEQSLPMPTQWSSATARCQGASHKLSGVPCQDQVCARVYPNGVHAIALADGAGSAALSHYGASLVVDQAADFISSRFDWIFAANETAATTAHLTTLFLRERLQALAATGIPLTAEEREKLGTPSPQEQPLVPCRMKDLASTLLLVAVKDNRFIALHLGDGVIGIEVKTGRRPGRTRLLSAPNNGEFSNETYFVTSDNAEEQMRVHRGLIGFDRQTITGFVLMSDGPENALYHKATRSMAPACSKLLRSCRALHESEMSPRLQETLENVITRKTSDDCSLALLARRN